MAPRLLAALGLLLALASSLRADEFDDEEPPRPIPEQGTVFREVRSVPYPSGALHLEKGITGAFLGGKYRQGEAMSLFQWQGELGYFYTKWFSAGLAFKIRAGEPSDTVQKVTNRYFANARFHKAWSAVAIYIGPQIGVDNLNILSGSPIKDSVSGVIKEPIRNTNARFGIETGAGWKFARWGGLTLGSLSEFSLVGDEDSQLGTDLNLRVSPGVAVDVLSFSDGLRELVPALYVNVEMQLGFLLFNRASTNSDQAFILGVGLAF